MNRYRWTTLLLALPMIAAWCGAYVSIASVIGQPRTAVVIFAYGLLVAFSAFWVGRESMKP